MAQVTQCILCRSTDFRPVHRREPWTYLRCTNCKLVSLHPRPSPEELISNYQGYLPATPMEIRRWEDMTRRVVVRSADLVEAAAGDRQGNLLDIGSGYGFFLREMERRGWEVTGVEWSPTGRAYSRNICGAPVYSEPLEQVKFPEAAFDAVTLLYVIEHVHDPVRLLNEVKRILKVGGTLLLRWPHSTPIVKALGPLSRKLDLYHTPYHLYDFSPQSMRRLLRVTGFIGVETVVGGYTLPYGKLGRWSALVSGRMGEALFHVTGGRVLLPGISKTTLASKPFAPFAGSPAGQAG